MQFKDYYAALGVNKDATPEEVKHAYRKLARKYHPDLSKQADAEDRFKEVAEAYEVLKDAERRAAYDEASRRWAGRGDGQAPPGWDTGFEFSDQGAGGAGVDHSEFFEALFGRHAHAGRRGAAQARGQDHHAKVAIDIEDSYRGASRTIALQMPEIDSSGRISLHARQIELNIPKGIRAGQQLRLPRQGGPGFGDGPPGDLYLEVEFRAHKLFRTEGRDVLLDLPLAPWEAALGESVTVPTPQGNVELRVPAGSTAGRRLRLRGRGLPGQPPGDLYAVLSIALPGADSAARQEAYRSFAKAFDFDPRRAFGEESSKV
ncbi:MAG: DnaJ C-terminal domain-containing protein [Burkholderiaceae bacterium]